MYPRAIFTLLFACSAFGIGLAIPAFARQCPTNEVFATCGSACPPTCEKPNQNRLCTRQCVVGCFCKPGYLRQENGVCVPSSDCALPPQLDFAPPVFAPVCPSKNEVFQVCKQCDATCDEPNPICNQACVQGCTCDEGYVRDNGQCIPRHQCQNTLSNTPNDRAKRQVLEFMPGPVIYQPEERIPEIDMPVFAPVCPNSNEVFQVCKQCDATCDDPNPICVTACVQGCTCDQGHVRDNNGQCIPVHQCPNRMPQNDLPIFMPGPVIHKPEERIPEIDMPVFALVCPNSNEVFQVCKQCDATCDDPNPICVTACVQGCTCDQGHVRDNSGQCIPVHQCPNAMPQKDLPVFMPGPVIHKAETTKEQKQTNVLANIIRKSGAKCPSNEIFRSCGSACPPTCDEPRPNAICSGHCVVGCFCVEGYLRNSNGICVPADKCETLEQH